MNITPRVTPFRRIIPPVVRNLSKDKLSATDREFIVNETMMYLVGGDHPVFVVGYVTDGWYELEARSPVREGYTAAEVVAELNEDRTFEGCTHKVWFVCQLSSSRKTVSVKEVHREH